jgi:hypothetical protein
LQPGKDYSLVFWADFVVEGAIEATAATADNYYQTNDGYSIEQIIANPTCDRGLQHIVFHPSYAYGVNDEARDAYCGVFDCPLSSIAAGGALPTQSITLIRPFSKLRLMSIDSSASIYRAVTASMNYAVYEIYGGYNALTEQVLTDEVVEVGWEYPRYEVTREHISYAVDKEYDAVVLAFDYVFPITGLKVRAIGYNSSGYTVGSYTWSNNVNPKKNKFMDCTE